MSLYKIIIFSLILTLVPLYAQEAAGVDVRQNKVIINADGSKTIITYGVNDRGKDIKTVTIIKITKFLDGSKLISKSVKIFGLDDKEEVLEESYIQNSIIRPRRRNYKTNNLNRLPSRPTVPITPIGPGDPGGIDVSPDGR